MSDIKIGTVEPDPAATSLDNAQTVNSTEGTEQAEKPAAQLSDELAQDLKSADAAPVNEEIAKDIKVETVGNAINGSPKDEKEENTTTKDKAGEKGEQIETPQKRRYEDRDNRRGNGRGRDFKRYKPGTRFDPTIQDETDDPVAIRKQVEFYFSDANLARDKFLFDKCQGPKNIPIDIKDIHSFKRMRRFQPYSAVVKALRESEVLTVTEDEKVSRKTALPSDFENKTMDEIKAVVEDESMARSVYVKGFGGERPSTQFDIEAWFANFGATNQVRLRRLDDKTFKGSVFVEFDSEETAKKFLALDPKPKFNERDLRMMSKKQYCDEKVQAIKEGKIQPNGNGGYEPTDKAKKEDNRDWRERRDEDRKKGFKDDRRDRGGQRGRGRGRGRGGRDRGGRDRRDRKEERAEKEDVDRQEGKVAKNAGETVEDTKSMNAKDAEMKDAAVNVAEASKKRSREEGDEGDQAAKKEKVNAES